MIFFFFTLKYCLLLRNQFLECHFWKSLDSPRIAPSMETCEKIAKVLNSKRWMRVILVWMCLKMAWLDIDSFYWKKKIKFQFSSERKNLKDTFDWQPSIAIQFRILISDGLVNSYSRKIHIRKWFLAFYEIMFHFSS